MTFFEIFTVSYSIFLTAIIPLLFINLIKANKKIKNKNDELNISDERYTKMYSQKKSSEVRLGQIAENFAPILNSFPYDPKKGRFIGSPIDMVVFDDEEVAFIEFKTGESQLNNNQRKVRDLVNSGKVVWKEIRIK